MPKMSALTGVKIVTSAIAVFVTGAVLASAPVRAAENGNHGRGHAEKSDGDHGPKKNGNGKFSSGDRAAVRAYFAKSTTCPPGLAKKGNGCRPPGQAKKDWAIGSALPPTVTFEAVPAELAVRLTLPPVGYTYVRVAGDILMMAEGTRMIADAIADLGG